MPPDKEQIRRLLQAYRPGSGPTGDPEVDAVLRSSAGDAEIEQFLREEEAFDRAFAAKLRQSEVPEHLPERILGRIREVEMERNRAIDWEAESRRQRENARGGWSWLHFGAFAAAAVVVILLALNFTFKARYAPTAPTVALAGANPAADIEAMVSLIGEFARSPRDLRFGNGFGELSAVLASKQAPIPRRLPASLGEHAGFACAAIEINGVPVGMVCFRENDSTFHLFTIERSSMPAMEVPEAPRIVRDREQSLAYWANEEQIFVLAAKADETRLREMF